LPVLGEDRKHKNSELRSINGYKLITVISMIKIEKEFVSISGRHYIRTLDAVSENGKLKERTIWRCDSRRIRNGRYLSGEQWEDIERQVREAYAEECDVDFTSIFEIYPRDYTGHDGILFYETYSKGDDQFGHSSNIQHIGPVGSYVPKPTTSSALNYNATVTTSFSKYAMEAKAARAEAEKKSQTPSIVQMDYAAMGIK